MIYGASIYDLWSRSTYRTGTILDREMRGTFCMVRTRYRTVRTLASRSIIFVFFEKSHRHKPQPVAIANRHHNDNKMMKHHFLRLLAFCIFCIFVTTGHESCCKHKLLQKEQASEFIIDPTDFAPQVSQGEPRFIPDPEDERPDDWDDEDDGPWEPNVVLNPNYAWKPRMIPNPNYIAPPTFWDKLSSEIKAAIPWVTLGVLMTGLLATISLPLETLQLHLSSSNNSRGNFIQAALVGLATPLCSCGALPLASGLLVSNTKGRGGSVSLATALVFLTASQSAGLDSAAITWGLLGPIAALCRLAGAIVLAIAVGWAASFANKIRPTVEKKDSTSCCQPPSPIASYSGFLESVLSTLLDTATEIIPTVVLGLAISTAALRYLPSLMTTATSSMEEESPLSSLFLRLCVLVSVTPLQLCEHSTVTLAAAIPKAGGSPGLAFSFLLSAPAINMPSLLFLLKHGGVVTIICVLVALVSVAVVLSYVVDMLGVNHLLHVDHDSLSTMADLPQWFVIVSPWLAAGLFLAGMLRRHFLRYNHPEQATSASSCCGSHASSTLERKGVSTKQKTH